MPQKLLAFEVTELVHGLNEAKKAETMGKVFFDSDLNDLRASRVIEAFLGDERMTDLPKESFSLDIVNLLIACKVFPSKCNIS